MELEPHNREDELMGKQFDIMKLIKNMHFAQSCETRYSRFYTSFSLDSRLIGDLDEYFSYYRNTWDNNTIRKYCDIYDTNYFKDEVEYLTHQIVCLDQDCLQELINTEPNPLFLDLISFINFQKSSKNKEDEEKEGNEEEEAQVFIKLRPIDIIILCNNASHFEKMFSEYEKTIEHDASNTMDVDYDKLKTSQFFDKFGLALIPKKNKSLEASNSNLTKCILKSSIIR